MAVLTFSHQYRPKERYFTNSGSGEKILYTAEYDSKGRLVLRESGKEDLYGFIQSHRDSVDIHVLLKRFAAGEEDVMSRVQGFYADVADMPTSFADVLNLVRRGEDFFDHLPAEEKAKYGNSFAQFLSRMDVRNSDLVDRGDPSGEPEENVSDVEKEGVKE